MQWAICHLEKWRKLSQVTWALWWCIATYPQIHAGKGPPNLYLDQSLAQKTTPSNWRLYLIPTVTVPQPQRSDCATVYILPCYAMLWHDISLGVLLVSQSLSKFLLKVSIRYHTGIDSIFLTLCEGNPPVTGGFPSQRASKIISVPVQKRYMI